MSNLYLFDVDTAVAAECEHRAPNTWDKRKLHVTDLSACTKQVVQRQRGDRETPLTPQDINMFDLANYQHDRVYRALELQKALVFSEQRAMLLPDEWGGTADYGRLLPSGRVRLGDVKTSHPNWVQASSPVDYPKPEHVLQVSTYFHHWDWLNRVYELDEYVEVTYLDRGGANPSRPTVFSPLPAHKVTDKMAALEAWVERAKVNPLDLPPVLPQGVHWGKTWGPVSGELKYGPPWNCRYCHIIDCPNERKDHIVGKITKKKGLEFVPMAKHFEHELYAFLFEKTKRMFSAPDKWLPEGGRL